MKQMLKCSPHLHAYTPQHIRLWYLFEILVHFKLQASVTLDWRPLCDPLETQPVEKSIKL